MNDWIIVKKEKSDYLAHHGIEKQKWGVRHGPPYPLDYEDHSKAQKKEISKYKFTSKKSQLPPKQRKSNTTKQTETVISASKKFDKKWKEQGFFDDFVNDIKTENNISTGKTIVESLTKTVQMYSDLNPDGTRSYFKPLKDVNFKETGVFDTDITRGANNEYFNDINNVGGKMNCVSCSIAAELLAHGIKGAGAPLTKIGHSTMDVINNCFDDYDEDEDHLSIDTVGDDIESVLREKFGNNSSGILTGSRTKPNPNINGSKVRDGGHAMHFTIDNDGNVEVQDAQSRKRYSSIKQAFEAEHFDTDFKNGTNFYNLTNTKPNLSKLVNGGIITTSFTKLNGRDTAYTLNPYNSNKLFGNMDEAINETKLNLYDAYKQYKKENYWDKEDTWNDDD